MHLVLEDQIDNGGAADIILLPSKSFSLPSNGIGAITIANFLPKRLHERHNWLRDPLKCLKLSLLDPLQTSLGVDVVVVNHCVVVALL